MAEAGAGVRRHFASDNWAGAHPEVLAAIAAASTGHAPSYGEDAITQHAVSRIQALFGAPVSVFIVFNGTAANVLGLASALKPYQAVICAESAHLNVDECGAYEHLAGGKLLTIATNDGKLTPELVAPRIAGVGVVHSVQAAAISIAQSTECGTVYSTDEVAALSRVARANGLLLHVDGARLANAAVTLGVAPGAFTTGAGVDILSFGGTKNGLLGAEAVIFADPARAADFGFVRKQGMQLASKMRFIAAQFDALLTDNLWLRSAEHANRMAQRLYDRVRRVPGVAVTQRVEANAVFARIPRAAIAPLQERFSFYVWNERTAEVRWMTSFDTTTKYVDDFAAAIVDIDGAAAPVEAGR
jgi:threonine aldolase